MKTIVCTEPKILSVVDTESPVISKQSEVKVSIKRVGICGTDIHAFGGNQPFFTYPRVLGHELSGVIEEVGSEVSNLQKGDLVAILPYINCDECSACQNGKTNCCKKMQVLGVHIEGGMAESIIVPSLNVFPVNQLSLEMASIVEPLSIGAHAVRRSEIQTGECVLIIGAGPIGLGVAKFAKLQGAHTSIMDISESRLEFAKKWTECDSTILASKDTGQLLEALNEGNLPSIVFDATGNQKSMMQAFDYVEHGGKLIYVGLVKENISFFDPDFHSKELTLMGSRNATIEDFQYVIQCMNDGEIDEEYISSIIDFNDVISHFEKGDFGSNKTLIRFGK
ncbi:zinc-binding alcohol dehydrogenase family protein [Planococcus beigongshangi]|uniref:zinc-binding alcohol dehydrogenase family protein n=1 Tax=Planococcus beigongshangi TaxID=2782536 RepID=UPI00193B6E57|nr:zinc-binding alcohol dehydrogenase family protein [Planococcus beigongshangi]